MGRNSPHYTDLLHFKNERWCHNNVPVELIADRKKSGIIGTTYWHDQPTEKGSMVPARKFWLLFLWQLASVTVLPKRQTDRST